jgi:hypothetical protein
MPLNNGKNSIIHTAAAANLSGYTYTQVYAGAAASPTINGVAITMAAGSTINIIVKDISATASVYVIGDEKSTSDPGGKTGKFL